MRNLLLLLLVFMFSLCPSAEETVKVTSWKKIIGWKHPELQIYVDLHSVRQEINDDTSYGTGAVLFHRDYPVIITINDTSYVTTSVVRYYIVSCDKRLMMSMVDYYYNLNRLVLSTDKPILIIDHSKKAANAKEISKYDPLYKTMCPEYV